MPIVKKTFADVIGIWQSKLLDDYRRIINDFSSKVSQNGERIHYPSDFLTDVQLFMNQFIQKEDGIFLITLTEFGSHFTEYNLADRLSLVCVKSVLDYTKTKKFKKYLLVDCSSNYNGFKEITEEKIEKEIEEYDIKECLMLSKKPLKDYFEGWQYKLLKDFEDIVDSFSKELKAKKNLTVQYLSDFIFVTSILTAHFAEKEYCKILLALSEFGLNVANYDDKDEVRKLVKTTSNYQYVKYYIIDCSKEYKHFTILYKDELQEEESKTDWE